MAAPSKVQDMLDARGAELKRIGYADNVITLALEWAVGSARGIAEYITMYKENHDEEKLQDMLVRTLPRYLKDCELWIKKTCQ